MLTSFGVFFVGEGIGVSWWHEDVSILLLVALFATLFVACTWFLRHPRSVRVPHLLAAVAAEIWGLVVGGGMLALAAVDRRARGGAARRAGGRRGGLGRTAAGRRGRHGAPDRGRRFEAA